MLFSSLYSLPKWLFIGKNHHPLLTVLTLTFPGSSDGKESACNAGDPCLIPGSGSSILAWRIPWAVWWAMFHGVAKSWTQLSNLWWTWKCLKIPLQARTLESCSLNSIKSTSALQLRTGFAQKGPSQWLSQAVASGHRHLCSEWVFSNSLQVLQTDIHRGLMTIPF